MPTSKLFDFLNKVMKKLAPIIRSNNGFIDKYIGDAIMALFPSSPNDAIKAAIAMSEVHFIQSTETLAMHVYYT